MQKVKKLSKQILSVVLALVLTLAYVPLLDFESEAAATKYKWRVSVYVTKGSSLYKDGNVVLNYITNNGTGSSGSVTLNTGTGGSTPWNNDDGKVYSFVSDSSISAEGTALTASASLPDYAFPVSASAWAKLSGNWFSTPNSKWMIRLEVFDNSGNLVSTSDYGSEVQAKSNAGAEVTNTATDTVSNSYYPYVNSWSFSDSSDVYIADNGTATRKVTLAAVDQYGVDWVNAPSSISASNDVTVDSTTSKTPTFTFKDKSADYQTTINATYNNAHSNGSTTMSKGLNVKVTKTLTFDNLFDYNAWRRAGITSGNAAVSNITTEGFTLKTTSGNDGYCNFSIPVAVEPSTAYKLTADVTGSGYQIFVETLDANKAHIQYYNVTDRQEFPFTTESNCAYISIRFDSNALNNSITVKNIRLVKMDSVAADVSVSPPEFSVSSNKKFADYQAPIPTKPGYVFTGWYWNGNLCYDATGKWVFAGNENLAIGGYTTDYRTDFYSAWTLANYTITFVDANGNTFATDTYTIEDTSITLPASNPSRAGYYFAGWVVASTSGNWNANDAVSASISRKYGNVTVKPVWEKSTYEVNFNSNGGSAIDTIYYSIDQTLTLPTPTRTGYTFKGWEVVSAWGGTSDAENTFINSHTSFAPGFSQSGMYGCYSLKAVWEATSYTINFETDGSAVSSMNYTIEDTVTLPTTSKTGYTFEGWKVSANNGNWSASEYKANTAYTSMYGNVTLVAQWKAIPYAITFVDWDGTVLQQTDVDYDTMPTPPADPTRPSTERYNYTFKGWEPNVDVVTGAALYTATYTETPITFTITFVDYNGDVITTVNYDCTDTSVTLPTASRTGYTFHEWTVNAASGSWAVGDFGGTLSNAYGNVTVTANYYANDYVVSYNANGGTLTDETTFTATYDSPIEYLTDYVTRDGYTFAGWTLADGTPVNIGDVWTYTDVTEVYAQWEAIEYTLTLNNYNSTTGEFEQGAVSTFTYTVETDIQLPCPERTGYDFANWRTGLVANGSWTRNTEYGCDLGTGNYGNATMTLNYTAKMYTITWVTGSGTFTGEWAYDSMPDPAVDGVDTSKAPSTHYSYEFAGWDNAITTVTGNATYTATYTDVPRVYTITWVVDGVTTTESYEYGQTPVFKGSTDKAANAQYTYTFKGWDKTLTAVDDDVTYTAVYDSVVNKYTITWIVDGVTTTEDYEYGQTPEFKGSTDKAADAQYTYTFTGWDNALVTVTGPATYTAQYTNTTNTYTVIWNNADGSLLEKDEFVPYGTIPSYDGETPTKAADVQYTYTFDKWTPEVDEVTGDVTYTATYKTTLNKYTITFVDEDGTTVLDEQVLDFGTTPVYGGAEPTKDATAEWTYTFSGWDRDIVAVNGNATYTAQYTASKNTYTITFVNENGDVLQSGKVAYGVVPSYTGSTPTKDATAQYTYTHSGWTPEITAVTEAATYTATYTSTINKYDVIWYNYDGSVLETDRNVEFGAEPTYDGVTPEKPADSQYTYAFSGWATSADGEVLNVLPTVGGTMEFYAIFVSSDAEFDVMWADAQGNVITSETDVAIKYGTFASTIVPSVEPAKAADAKYTYTFIGWNIVEGSEEALDLTTYEIKSAITFYPAYSKTVNEYTITFKNENGDVLQTGKVAYDEIPVYTGATPEKAATAKYTYTFAGWNTEIVTVTGDAEYVATYTSTVNEYTITFKNENGDVLQTGKVAYDELPVYAGATPTKDATAQYTFTFAGWNTSIVTVTGDAEYVATYTSTVNKYVIEFVNDNGDVLQSSEVEYGDMPVYTGATPTKDATAKYTYTFADWDTAIVSVTGAATYTATYTSTVNEYTITFRNENGDVLQTGKVAYDELPVYAGATPTKDATAQYTFTFAGWNTSIVTVTGDAEYIATYSSTVNKYTITWITGTATYTGEWDYGSTPDPVADGVDTSKASTVSTDYAFAGWDNAIAEVTGAATYTATYTETTRKYTITWITGTATYTGEWDYGSTPDPVANGVDTSKASTVSTVYTFAGWDNAIAAVEGAATYTATYTETTRKYTITWVTGAGTFTGEWNYGSTPDPEADGVDTSKASTAESEYTFANWNSEITAVTGAKTYTAVYTEEYRSYTVTYKVNGEVLETQTVKYMESFSHPVIPAKEGHDAYWNVSFMTMPAKDLTIEAVYTPKKYTVTWVADDSTAYTEEVEFGASIPVKNVPEKIGHTGVWDIIPEKMPAQAVTITAVYTANTYSVVWSFTSGADSTTATYGVDFEITFDYYIVPIDVRVTVNGEVLESGYTYENGTLFISGSCITGYISISEKAAEGFQNVVVSGLNATLTNSSAVVKEGEAFHTQIIPTEGYKLPESIVICVDGIELNEGYTYDPATGRITINAEVMYGEISIRFDCPSIGGGTGICGCNCHSDSAFVRFFFSIATFFRQIFGMEQYRHCDCGAAHW